MPKSSVFKFKEFDIRQDQSIMKVNTDGVLLGAWSNVAFKEHALDIGTGTGVIAIMIAQKNYAITVKGIEIDAASCHQAKLNMKNSPFSDRLEAIHISLQQYALQSTAKFDLLISNPPFFTGGIHSTNENKANVRHTIKLSHHDLLCSAKQLLTKDGHFDLILPYTEGLKFVELAQKFDLYLNSMTSVRSRQDKQIERILLRFGWKRITNINEKELIVYSGQAANDYTADFIEITKIFYLNM
ncbi:MAG: methyltransferase [Saprospiraceae bacterium]|nr:methyltransferase [Saprospiraceae bacterium]